MRNWTFVLITVFVTSVFPGETGFTLQSKTSVYRAITVSTTEFELNGEDTNSIDSIRTNIDYYNDSETQKKSLQLLLGGKKTTNNENFNIGAELNTPIFLYRHSPNNNTSGYDAAAMSIGFTAESVNWNFPFGFSLGPAFEGGINRIIHDPDDSYYKRLWGMGGYFSIFGGDDSLGSRIAESPFLFDANLTGRYVYSDRNYRNTASKFRLTVERNGVFGTDSLILSVSDTTVWGEVNSQFGYFNELRTAEIPNKYSNNLNVLLRATQIGDGFFEPSFEFWASDNRYRYLNTDRFYGSLKRNTLSASVFLNKELGSWNFETGIGILAGTEENCYLSDGKGSGSLIDTLNEKLKNADVFNPRYYFLSEFLSPREIMYLSARYVIERQRRTYPFEYDMGNIIMHANDDFDNVSNQMKIQCDLYLTQIYNLYLSAELLKYQIHFLKPQMSAASRSERRYTFELGNIFTNRDSLFIFSIKGNTSAAPQKYFFAENENTPLPYHNRSFSFASDLLLQYNNGWSNYLYFSLGQFDRGIIYDERYYGIESKKYETVSSLSLSKSTVFFVISSGIEAKRMKSYNFNYMHNDYESRGISYILTPFISGNAAIKDNFLLDFYVKRSINKGFLSSKDLWDLSVSLVWNK